MLTQGWFVKVPAPEAPGAPAQPRPRQEKWISDAGRNTLMSRSLWGKTKALNQPLPGRTIIEINFVSEVCRG